jgi:hypothetical protein
VVYALLTEGLDSKERETFDADLYAAGPGGWNEMSTAALDRLVAIGDAGEGSVPLLTEGT